MNHTAAKRRSRFVQRLMPRRSPPEHFALGLIGVFVLFMPVGFQVEMLQHDPLSWTRGLAQALISSVIATVWAALGMLRLWWPMPFFAFGQLLISPLLMAPLIHAGVFDRAAELPRQTTLSILVGLSVVTLASGFAILMRAMIMGTRRSQAARAELDVARRVHESIVPPIDMRFPGVQVLASSRASSTMGGDLIDVVAREGEVDVFVADVSGHGVKAGIVMAMLKASVRTRLSAGGQLGEILQDVNRLLADLTDPSMFATLACVRIRANGAPGGAEIEYALAGHLPILHVASDRSVRDLPNQSLPLGIEPGECYVAGRTHGLRGDVLALFTDGLVEVQGRNGRELGLAAVRDAVRDSASGSLESMRRGIMSRVESHGQQIDDQTLALVRID